MERRNQLWPGHTVERHRPGQRLNRINLREPHRHKAHPRGRARKVPAESLRQVQSPAALSCHRGTQPWGPDRTEEQVVIISQAAAAALGTGQGSERQRTFQNPGRGLFFDRVATSWEFILFICKAKRMLLCFSVHVVCCLTTKENQTAPACVPEHHWAGLGLAPTGGSPSGYESSVLLPWLKQPRVSQLPCPGGHLLFAEQSPPAGQRGAALLPSLPPLSGLPQGLDFPRWLQR